MTAPVLLCGIPSEGPLARVGDELERAEVPFVVFHQRRFDEMELDFGIVGGEVSGWLRIGSGLHRLEDFGGVYTRLMEDARLPELRGEPAHSPRRAHARRLHDGLAQWYEIAPARVLNRSGPMGSNFSKPYQSQLIARHGFRIPETLITNDPDAVAGFRRRHGRVVYKSISGVRSIVRTLSDEDLGRLGDIRWCPVQFQADVPGGDVRVHTIGERVFATRIDSEATDYRYAQRDFGAPEPALSAFELDDGVAERCVGLAAALDLPFAGLDLRLAPDGEVFCFEVNPSPAFSYYEGHTGQPIARAVVEYLAGGPARAGGPLGSSTRYSGQAEGLSGRAGR
jgi:hypothetical protein